MIKSKSNISLSKYNTFGIDAKARQFIEINTISEAVEVFEFIQKEKMPFLILGGGSNVLFTADFEGIVVKNNLKGIAKIDENDDFVVVEAAAGENWHQFVMTCIDHNWSGLENLSLIPGNIGASPMQNIGAYGVEVKDRILSVEALNLESGELIVFENEDCEFGYRTSIFKTILKNKVFITKVHFKLDKAATFNTTYGAISDELNKMGIKQLTIKAVSDAVCNIRRSKLPDPNKLGNAGSFFKNPVVSNEKAAQIRAEFPGAAIYQLNDKESKLAAGWLIEQCGWKGYRENECGVHEKQALVIVNYGKASGAEVYELSEKILQSVRNKFGVHLEREVNIIPA